MSHFLATIERFAQGFDQINERLGQAISWLSLLMVLVTVTVVVLRYVFELGWIWLQESVTFMHAALFLVGAAYTLKHEGHVRVDIVYRKFTERGRAWVDLIGTLVFLLPVIAILLWAGLPYVAAAWSIREGSTETGGLMLFVQYQGPTTGGRPIYDGRFNRTETPDIANEDLER